MREIEHRGKRIDNGKWIYGNITMHLPGTEYGVSLLRPFTMMKEYEVDHKTVADYTGLMDKNKKKIFGDDFVKDDKGIIYLVYWHEEALAWFVKKGSLDIPLADLDGCVHGLEVINNSHDNPRLLEVVNG